jgi:DNA mismatch endonuclease (patch repair protein)
MKRGLDKLTKERRSWNMSRIRGKDTTPEMIVRRFLHKMGYRFRLHVRIPIGSTGKAERETQKGKLKTQDSGPKASKQKFVSVDIVLPKHRIAIFVHGCFWHRHQGCKGCTTPTHRREFWLAKLNGNAARDKLHQRALRKLGWNTVVIWECDVEKPQRLEKTLSKVFC